MTEVSNNETSIGNNNNNYCVLSDADTCDVGYDIVNFEEYTQDILNNLPLEQIIRFKIPIGNQIRTVCFDVLQLYSLLQYSRQFQQNPQLPYGNFCTLTNDQIEAIENRIQKYFPEYYVIPQREEQLVSEEGKVTVQDEINALNGLKERLLLELQSIDEKEQVALSATRITRRRIVPIVPQFEAERKQLLARIEQVDITIELDQEIADTQSRLPTICDQIVYGILKELTRLKSNITQNQIDYKQLDVYVEQTLQQFQQNENVINQTCNTNKKIIDITITTTELLHTIMDRLNEYSNRRQTRRTTTTTTTTMMGDSITDILGSTIINNLTQLQLQIIHYLIPILFRISQVEPNQYTENILPSMCVRGIWTLLGELRQVEIDLQNENYEAANVTNAEVHGEYIEEGLNCRGPTRSLLTKISNIFEQLFNLAVDRHSISRSLQNTINNFYLTAFSILEPFIDRLFTPLNIDFATSFEI